VCVCTAEARVGLPVPLIIGVLLAAVAAVATLIAGAMLLYRRRVRARNTDGDDTRAQLVDSVEEPCNY